MKKLYEEENIRAIADAIRAKTGKTGKMKLADMTSEVDTVSTSKMLENYIEGNLTEIELPNVTKVCAGALIASGSKKISLPNVTELEQGAFANSSADEIRLDNLENLPSNAFSDCGARKNIENDSALTIFAPKVKTIESGACIGGYIYAFSFPNCESVGASAFEGCYFKNNLLIVSEKLASIDANAFYGTNLTDVLLPAVLEIPSEAFCDCSELTTVDLPTAQSIGPNAFGGCSSLTRVILRSNTICALPGGYPFENCDHFNKSPNDGHIYVPASLLADYQAAQYWSTSGIPSMRIRALEDFTVDGTTTGALDDAKIAAQDEADANTPS